MAARVATSRRQGLSFDTHAAKDRRARRLPLPRRPCADVPNTCSGWRAGVDPPSRTGHSCSETSLREGRTEHVVSTRPLSVRRCLGDGHHCFHIHGRPSNSQRHDSWPSAIAGRHGNHGRSGPRTAGAIRQVAQEASLSALVSVCYRSILTADSGPSTDRLANGAPGLNRQISTIKSAPSTKPLRGAAARRSAAVHASAAC